MTNPEHAPPNGEATPLLRDEHAVADDADSLAAERRRQRRHLLRTAIPFVIVLITVEFAASLCAAGVAALVEGSLCMTAFPEVTAPYGDARCKDEGVQADLAWIIGMENTISVVPGLLMSIPYGIIADKYGPNIVLGLIWVGQFFSEGGHLLVCAYSTGIVLVYKTGLLIVLIV